MLAIAIVFCLTTITLAVIYTRALERLLKLSMVNHPNELAQEGTKTKVVNALKRTFEKAYTMEDE